MTSLLSLCLAALCSSIFATIFTSTVVPTTLTIFTLSSILVPGTAIREPKLQESVVLTDEEFFIAFVDNDDPQAPTNFSQKSVANNNSSFENKEKLQDYEEPKKDESRLSKYILDDIQFTQEENMLENDFVILICESIFAHLQECPDTQYSFSNDQVFFVSLDCLSVSGVQIQDLVDCQFVRPMPGHETYETEAERKIDYFPRVVIANLNFEGYDVEIASSRDAVAEA